MEDEAKYIDGNGNVIPLADFIIKQEKDQKDRETLGLHKKDSGRYVATLRRMKKSRAFQPEYADEVVTTRIFTPEEIEKIKAEEEKLMSEIEMGMFKEMMKHQGEWIWSNQYYEAFPDEKPAGLSSYVSKIFRYLEGEGMMIRRPKEGKRGRAMEYLFKAQIADLDEEAPIWYEKYTRWKLKELKKKRDSTSPPTSK